MTVVSVLRDGLARGTLVAGLVLGALGLGAAWLATQPRPAFPVGIPILLAGSAIATFAGRRIGSLVGLAAAGLVAGRLVTSDRIGGLWFADGAALGAARWLQALGLLVATVSAVALLLRRSARGVTVERRPQDPVAKCDRRARAAQVAALLMLSAVGAELLAAYDDSTGRPGRLLFAVVFFAALYGAPALLIREVARRNGWGWPSIIMLAFALGIIQPGVIDQALFSTDYRDIETWNQSLRGTFIDPLGFSATNALNFVLGHVIYSFCAPIAVAEAWRPKTAHTPWVGLPGAAAAASGYVLAAAVILTDPESHSASAAQVTASVVAAGLCVGAAVILGRRRPRRPRTRRAPRLLVTVAASFLLLAAATAVPENWTGVAITTSVLAAGAALLGHVSRGHGWSVRHAAAVATGALVSRGILAFLYYPLIGETSPARKYTHNAVMLTVVGVAGWLALRERRSHLGTRRSDPVEHSPAPSGLRPAAPTSTDPSLR
ncbi:hypothetical protein [Micromonospora sp. NPDC049679]|uniref:hypothetical protein n=1 Tax=Micromonospora sp. NPDC049679 TaxID=3155920 RepID=UPI00340071C3